MSALCSESIEPALAAASSLCIAELVRSPGAVEDWRRFRDQLVGIRRVAMCNSDGKTGVHASLASGTLERMATDALDWTDDRRGALLEEIRTYPALAASQGGAE